MKYLVRTLTVGAQEIANPIETQSLNALLGTTRLKATEPANKDKALVDFLLKHPNYELKKEGDKEDKKTIYQYKEQGVIVKTKQTGISIPSLDDFVETISIKATEKRLLPYNCDVTMSCREFCKKLKLLDFKYNRSKRHKIKNILRKEVFESETVTVELYFKKDKFTRMILIANLDAMYGGLLIKTH